ncbi:MAG: hypothetical protein K6U00_01910 [Armatimonadetes bacterium]|nr:hypothetical protein [Armatimonadota bacterium]
MKITENQKTQVIILSCLIIAVVIFGIYRMLGTTTQASPKVGVDSQAKKVAEKAASIENQAPANEQPMVRVALGDVKARDPFTPQVGPKVQSSASTTSGISRSIVPPSIGSIPPLTEITPIGSPTIRLVSNDSEKEALSDLRLTGVIEGDTNVAIFRLNDNTRYIVREGQVIDGRFTVESISRLGVRLRSKHGHLFVKLGASLGSQNTASAQTDH